MSEKERAKESNRQPLIVSGSYGKDKAAAKRLSRLEIDAQTFGSGDNPSFGDIILSPGPGVTPGPTPPPTPPAPPTPYRGFVIHTTAQATGVNGGTHHVLRSFDKGLTWSAVAAGTISSVWSSFQMGNIVSGPFGSFGLSVLAVFSRRAGSSTQFYQVNRSFDSGETWSEITPAQTNTRLGQASTGGTGVWFFAASVRSTNNVQTLAGGTGFSSTSADIRGTAADELGRFRAVSTGTVGTYYSAANAVFGAINTSDTTSFTVRSMAYAGNNRFIAVGDSGGIAYADNYNGSWVNLGFDNSPNTLNDVTSNRNGVVIAVGQNGQVVRSVDSGLTWQAPAPLLTSNLVSVSSNDENVFIAIADNNDVWRSTDFGATWTNLGDVSVGLITADIVTMRSAAPIL
jgi:hypothetical protein